MTPLAAGGWEIGIHIAAPAAGHRAGFDARRATRPARLSTIYVPGQQDHDAACVGGRAVSLGAKAAPVRRCRSTCNVARIFRFAALARSLEQIRIAANLRHDVLEQQFNEETLNAGLASFPFAARAEDVLWELATVLEGGRGRPEPMRTVQMDYNFYVENDRVRIVERQRGSPVDKLVAELMILVNSEWGRNVAEAGIPAIYRVQSNGKVRMSTVPAAHQGLGVAQYIWASSPLRRYVDLINQRQIIAWLRSEPPPYAAGSEQLLTAMRDFEPPMRLRRVPAHDGTLLVPALAAAGRACRWSAPK